MYVFTERQIKKYSRDINRTTYVDMKFSCIHICVCILYSLLYSNHNSSGGSSSSSSGGGSSG